MRADRETSGKPVESGIPTPGGPPTPGPVRATGCLVLACLILAAAAAFLWHFYTNSNLVAKDASGGKAGGSKGAAGGAAKTVPVLVAQAGRKNVPVQVSGIGNVQPFSTVPVVSQVTGQLVHVHFKQGDFVRRGQPLFDIDSRPLEASLQQVQANVARDSSQVAQARSALVKDDALIGQARANVEKDRALVRQAQSNLDRDLAQLKYDQDEDRRYSQLLHQGMVTAEQAEQIHSTALAFQGTIQADRQSVQAAQATQHADELTINSLQASRQADEDAVRSVQGTQQADEAASRNAAVQLSYTSIKSPLDGRTGSLNQYEGSLVRANDTNPLVTIDQITPIYVSFSVPEQYLADIRKFQDKHPLEVQAILPEDAKTPEAGKITFIDNAVDPTTGTIALRATFPNRSRRLWPGKYVNVNLLLTQEANATVVPSQAVQPGQNGDYVFVVNPDMTVDNRPVKVERILGDESIIASGIKPGETVVTDGQLQLTPGAKIQVKTPGQEPPAAPGKKHGGHRRPAGSASENPPPSGAPSPEASGSPAPSPQSP